jgi:hypothetical protein
MLSNGNQAHLITQMHVTSSANTRTKQRGFIQSGMKPCTSAVAFCAPTYAERENIPGVHTVNALVALCNWDLGIKALVFMERKKKDGSVFPRFFCNFEKGEIDQVDQSLEDALLERNNLAKEFLDLDLKYQEAKNLNKKMKQFISQLNADKKVLQTQNDLLNKQINFLEKHHDLQIQELKTQLKHQEERRKYPTVKSPST